MNEVAGEVKNRNIKPEINERFINILEGTIPSIAKETVEDKRLAYVALLANSISVTSDDKEEGIRYKIKKVFFLINLTNYLFRYEQLQPNHQ